MTVQNYGINVYMSKIKIWAAKNQAAIMQYIERRNYLGLIKFYANGTGMSNVKLAALFHCDRRSLRRYLSGERQVPMDIVAIMLRSMGTSYATITVADDASKQDCNANGSLIWYGGHELLANTLYFYRTLEWNVSRFEMSCKLGIQEDALWEYEHGKRRIPSSVVQRILQNYPITLTELFPTIISYDGGKTYLQLDTRFELNLGGKTYDILDDEMYIGPNGEYVSFYMPQWPTWRYDTYTKPLLKYMPDELTMDEYYNTSDLYFIKDEDMESFYEGGDFSRKKLPPSYRHIQEFYNEISNSATEMPFSYHIKSYAILDNYKVQICLYTRPAEFDLSNYVFSDSPWYQMLQDPEYFKRGKLLSHNGSTLAIDSYLSWPDGQYVNIAELYMDKYKYNYYRRARGIGANGRLLYV